jgi:uncharacterized protein
VKLPGFRTDTRYFEMLTGLAARIVTAADLLSKVFADPSRVGDLVPRIKDVEHDADRLMRDIDERLERAFITPMDREDIDSLAYRLDSVIDRIDGTARRVVLFHVEGAVPKHAQRLAEVVARSGERLGEAVRDIRKEKALSMHLRSIKQLEEEGDALYHDGVAELFAGGHDPLDIIKWKELYDRLEATTDECQHTAQVVHSVALKYSGFTGPG